MAKTENDAVKDALARLQQYRRDTTPTDMRAAFASDPP